MKPVTTSNRNRARDNLARLTFGRDSLICHEARNFGQARQELFVATYMAMRMIDDHVDHQPACDRGPESPTLARIASWRENIRTAASGIAPGTHDPLEADILFELSRTLPGADLGPRPWDALALAMRADALGQLMSTFEDFLAYAEGATVAPTYVFTWLLAADDSTCNLSSNTSNEEIWDLARPLGISCYLTHIMRDLVQDARAGHNLLTIPRELWDDLSDDREALASLLAGEGAREVIILRHRLFERLSTFANATNEARNRLMQILAPENQLILKRILAHYANCAIQMTSSRGNERHIRAET
ncbi:MAG: squalene/phytoene synthase family protein [Geminicoccaceae bacterium]|nr:squalene/phytoene synthase family protein [Geminicoccaceae bacterium]